MTSASDLTELWRTIYDLGSGSGSVPAPCKISSLYRIFGSVCFLLPVPSVAGAGASLNHQTLEHFCHHDQGLWQDQSPSALYQQRQVESAAGRSRRVENEDLHQLLEVFQYEDFFSRNSIIVEVGKTSTLSQEGSLLKLQRFLVLCRQ